MMKFLLLGIIFTACFTAVAQDTRQVPSKELQLRDNLENDKSIMRTECWRRPRQLEETMRARFLAYDAIISKDKTIKLKQVCSTVEGTPVASYLIIEDGKAKLIADSSRDPWGYMRVLTYECDGFSAGNYNFDEKKKGMVFASVGDKNELTGNMPFFQCKSGNRTFVF